MNLSRIYQKNYMKIHEPFMAIRVTKEENFYLKQRKSYLN